MILRNPLHVERVFFEFRKHRKTRKDDTDDEIVVRELDVAWIEQFGQQAARLLRVMRLQASVLDWLHESRCRGNTSCLRD